MDSGWAAPIGEVDPKASHFPQLWLTGEGGGKHVPWNTLMPV